MSKGLERRIKDLEKKAGIGPTRIVRIHIWKPEDWVGPRDAEGYGIMEVLVDCKE
jgi:hypothetical protein